MDRLNVRLRENQQRAAPQEATLPALPNSSVDPFVVLSADGRVLHLNLEAMRLLRGTAALGQPWPQALRAEPGCTRELKLIDDAGNQRTFKLCALITEWTFEPAVLLMLNDITEHRAAEQALLLGRRAMEVSLQGIVIADASDAELPLIYVNPAFERITGYTRGEALGRGIGFLQSRDRDTAEVQLLEALARGEGADLVLRNYRKDGTPFWSELSVSPVRNPDGEVTHFVAILNDISERRRLEAERLKRTTHDPVTGLPNRKLLLDLMQQALNVSEQAQCHPAALLVHLAHLEDVNDSLGHELGERLLLEVVARLKSCLHVRHILCRLSDDEFMVLLPDLAMPEHAALVADQLLKTVSMPYLVDGQVMYCGCSIGVAAVDKGMSPMQLLQQSGIAAHAAKRAGHNAVHFYSDEVGKTVSDRLELRSGLQGAVAHGELELHYQPQLDLQHERICGVEVLLRWNHPELGSVSPIRFIPVAEETGLIVPIGEWVMEQACLQHRRWLDAGVLDCSVAVNVSGVQFQREGFVETVCEVLQRTGLPAHRLELELTESVTMDTGTQTLARLQRLRELGITLSIDDFGTGFSSLGYLKRLPIDKVKIDRSFVKDIVHDSDDAAITLSVIAIAHHLQLRVVAEGVETAAQLSYLKRHLCDEVQGYFISKPLPARELEAFLASHIPPRTPAAATGRTALPTLLLVDDEPNILRALTRLLRRDGYRILTADGAAAAFDLLAQNEVHVILSDQLMPQMCGTDFLAEVKSLYPHTVRMVLSDYTDLQTVTNAINSGAIYRFLTKPWEDDALRAHIKEAFLLQQRERAAAR